MEKKPSEMAYAPPFDDLGQHGHLPSLNRMLIIRIRNVYHLQALKNLIQLYIHVFSYQFECLACYGLFCKFPRTENTRIYVETKFALHRSQ